MAAKVNVRFVVGLASTVVLIVVVSWYLTTRYVYKPASAYVTAAEVAQTKAVQTQATLDRARAKLAAARAAKDATAVKAAQAEADAALAAANSDWNAVALAYSKAVSKERTNVEYLKKWLETLGRITPQPMEAYKDRFEKEWITAQRQLADAAPGDLGVQRAWLTLMISELRMGGGTPSAWERFILDTESALKGFVETDPGFKTIRRFRGMARVEAMVLASETGEEKAMLAKDDLEAALSVDADDGEAASMLATWYRVMAARSANAARSAEALQYNNEGLAFARKYVAERKNIAPMLFVLGQMELIEVVRSRKPGEDSKAIEDKQRAVVAKMVDQALTLPPETLDRTSAFSFAATAIGADIENARDKAMAVLERSLQGHPGDVMTIFKRGEIEMAGKGKRYDAAIERLQEVVDLDDRPLSIDGMLLFRLREEALARQCESAMALWQVSKTEEERKGAIAKAKEFRDRLVAQIGDKRSRVVLLDGKLAFAAGDLGEARRILNAYNDQTSPPRTDPAGLKLLGEVLRRLDNLPGSAAQFESVITLNPQDVEARLSLAQVLKQMNNLQGAKKQYEEALRVSPENQMVKQLMVELDNVLNGTESTDPIVRALSLAEKSMQQVPADLQGAKKAIRDGMDALKGPADWNTVRAIQLARGAMLSDDRELAKEIIEKARLAGVRPQELDNFLLQFNTADPNEARLVAIDASTYPEPLKCMLRAGIYRRMGQIEKAKAEVAKAKKDAPDDPVVIGGSFDQALIDNDLVEAGRLAKLGAEKNLDRMGGLIFKARLAQREATNAFDEKRSTDFLRLLGDAAIAAQEAVDKDSLNPMCWRLLGAIRTQGGQFKEAISAFEKALSLKHDDIETTKALIQCYLGSSVQEDGDAEMDRPTPLRIKALELARKTVETVSSDYELADMWLKLEGAYGDREKAIARRAEQFRRTPSDRNNGLQLAELYLKAMRPDDAKPAIDAAKAVANDVSVTQLLARYYAAKGDKAAAIKTYEDYLASLSEAERNQLVLWFDFARFASERLRDPATAVSILERVRNLQRPGEMEVDRELGDLAFSIGDYEKACGAYQRALDSVKNDVNNLIRFRIIEGRLRLKQYEVADKLCGEAETAGIKDSLQLCLLRSEAKIGVQDVAGATGYLDQAVRIDPKSPLPFFKRGQVRLVDPNQLADAIADFRQAVKLQPSFYAARKVLAEVLFSSGQVAECLKVLEEGVAANPDDGPLRRDQIMKLYQSGDTRGAMQALQEAMKRSNDPQWFIIGGELSRMQGDLPKAIEYYTRAFNAGVKTPLVTVPLVDSLLDQARPDTEQARKILIDEAVGTDKNPILIMCRARVNWLERRQNEAVKDLRTVFGMVDSKSSEQVKAFVEGVLKVVGRPPEALAIIDQFKPAGGFPDSVNYQIVRIKLMDAATVKEGLKELDDLIARNNKPEHKDELVQALKFLGDTMYAQRRYEQAAEVYKRTIPIAPEDAEPLNNYAYVLTKHLKLHQEALPMAQKAAVMLPNNPNILDTLGVVQLALRQDDEAIKTFEKAISFAAQPLNKVPILLHLAEARLTMSQRDLAQGWFDQIERELSKDPKVGKIFAGEIDATRKRLAGR